MKAILDLILRLLGRSSTSSSKPKAIESGDTPDENIAKVAPPVPGDEDIDEADGHEDYRGLLEREPDEKTPEEWGLGEIELVLKDGDEGPKVKEYQEWLESIPDYELSRFGADGGFGKETLSETREFQDDHDLEHEDALKLRGVGRETYERVKEIAAKQAAKKPEPEKPAPILPPSDIPVIKLSDGVKLYDITEKHAGKKRKRRRKWKDVKGITLHQTATNFGNNVMRYKNIASQVGITPDGKAILMSGLTWIVYHGHAFNSKDVGIEIDGHFAGLEEFDEATGKWSPNLKTYWRPKARPNRMPMSVSDAQVKATLAMIEWIINTVEEHGGKVEYIHAHRQSSKSRNSDPGQKVYNLIALEAMKRWGLKDGGPKFKLGGNTIPEQWNPAYEGNKYRNW